MTIEELMNHLQEAVDAGVSPQSEIRLATQPSWPFEYSISCCIPIQMGVSERGEIEEMLREGELTNEEKEQAMARIKELDDEPTIFYIAEGSQLGYLAGEAQSELGWGR